MKKTAIILFLSLNLFASTDELEAFLFSSPDPGVKTEAFVVYKNGGEAFSRYERGTPDTLHLLWSMSKSVTSLLFGIAEEKGLLNREDKVAKSFPEVLNKFKGEKRRILESIEVRHLLQMSSGIAWNEFYEEDPFNSNVVEMLYLKSAGSMGEYALSKGPGKAPGSGFHYSSGDTNILTTIMMKTFQKDLKNSYPWEWLFKPMGMETIFEQDGAGAFIGSSYLYLKTKDLAKLGHLIMNRGKHEGKQIVSKAYIEYATSLSPALKKSGCLSDSYMTYGAHFWLNASCPNGKRPFPQAPESLVMMLGHGGQSVFIFPEQKIVAVRIARDKEKALDKQKYAKLILEAFNE